MKKTLKASLEAGSEDGARLNDARVEVLSEFYKKNPFAYDVSRGKDSYSIRIEPLRRNMILF